MARALYPGSFDPVTNGHLDIIGRGARIFDEVVASVVRNPQKEPLFSIEERAEMLASACADLPTFVSSPSRACWWSTRAAWAPR